MEQGFGIRELAEALQDALWKHIGKPIFPDQRNSAKCELPRAWVQYYGVAVRLNPAQGEPDILSYREAMRYLAWLIAGNFGHHYYVENAYLAGEKNDK
jgi:hypothetical protein